MIRAATTFSAVLVSFGIVYALSAWRGCSTRMWYLAQSCSSSECFFRSGFAISTIAAAVSIAEHGKPEGDREGPALSVALRKVQDVLADDSAAVQK